MIHTFSIVGLLFFVQGIFFNTNCQAQSSDKMQQIIEQYYQLYEMGNDSFFTAFIATDFKYYRSFSMERGEPKSWANLQSDIAYYRKLEKKSFSYEQLAVQDSMAVYETTFIIEHKGLETQLQIQDVFYFNAPNQIQTIENYATGFNLDELIPPVFQPLSTLDSTLVHTFIDLLNRHDVEGLDTFLPDDLVQNAVYSGFKTKHDKRFYLQSVRMQQGAQFVKTNFTIKGKARNIVYADAVQIFKDGNLHMETPLTFQFKIKENTIQIITIELEL